MQIHVLLTCSKRKRGAEGAIRLSSVRGASLEERAEAWIRSLGRHTGTRVAARDLYQGEQWSLASRLEDEPPNGRMVQLWILSAGYGLVPADAPLLPYSATFSRQHPDSVFDPGFGLHFDEVVRRWWRRISDWKGPTSEPRAIADLVKGDAVLMVAASPIYLRAIRGELNATIERMERPCRLLVFSGGSDGNGKARFPVLSFGGRLRHRLGGSLMALNARVLAAVLREGGPLERGAVQDLLDRWMEATPKPEKPKRVPMTDAEVKQFLTKQLREDPGARWTPLLRMLRDDMGRSCEQKRFRSLFHSVSESTSSGQDPDTEPRGTTSNGDLKK